MKLLSDPVPRLDSRGKRKLHKISLPSYQTPVDSPRHPSRRYRISRLSQHRLEIAERDDHETRVPGIVTI